MQGSHWQCARFQSPGHHIGFRSQKLQLILHYWLIKNPKLNRCLRRRKRTSLNRDYVLCEMFNKWMCIWLSVCVTILHTYSTDFYNSYMTIIYYCYKILMYIQAPLRKRKLFLLLLLLLVFRLYSGILTHHFKFQIERFISLLVVYEFMIVWLRWERYEDTWNGEQNIFICLVGIGMYFRENLLKGLIKMLILDVLFLLLNWIFLVLIY